MYASYYTLDVYSVYFLYVQNNITTRDSSYLRIYVIAIRFTKLNPKLVHSIHYNKQSGLNRPILQIQHQIILCFRQ